MKSQREAKVGKKGPELISSERLIKLRRESVCVGRGTRVVVGGLEEGPANAVEKGRNFSWQPKKHAKP